MKPVKKLSLKKETLSELTDDQMRFVVGGVDARTHIGDTCNVPCHITDSCPSDDTNCKTVDTPCATQSCTYRDWCYANIALA